MKSPPPALPPLPQRLSLVAQTAQSLREGIRSGHWQQQLPGERELCERLQVSRRTLRPALLELEREGWLEVGPRQRRRIMVKAAPRSSGGQRKVIAILSARSFLSLPPPVALVIDALRDRLSRADCLVEFHVNQGCFSAHPARALEKLVQQHPVTAWLLFGSREPMQRWFIRRRLRCMVVGSCSPDIALPSIDSDHRATCRHAGGELLRKGHRRIALVLPQNAQGGDLDSEEGAWAALECHPDASLRVLRHDGTAAHLCALLDAALHSPTPPTAFLVARALHVLTVMMHVLRRGKRIPQDVAVISRDDDPFLQSTTPTVTRYATDAAQIARRVSLAARQLAETGALPAHAIRLMPKLIAGETV
jgi:DNA-binding LacI/PurR family transcriptional regulator